MAAARKTDGLSDLELYEAELSGYHKVADEERSRHGKGVWGERFGSEVPLRIANFVDSDPRTNSMAFHEEAVYSLTLVARFGRFLETLLLDSGK